MKNPNTTESIRFSGRSAFSAWTGFLPKDALVMGRKCLSETARAAVVAGNASAARAERGDAGVEVGTATIASAVIANAVIASEEFVAAPSEIAKAQSSAVSDFSSNFSSNFGCDFELVFIVSAKSSFTPEEEALLTKMIQAIGMKREEVGVLHETEALSQNIKSIQPAVVAVLGEKREKPTQSQGTHWISTFHPGFLLRNPAAKREAWADLQFIAAQIQKSSRKGSS